MIVPLFVMAVTLVVLAAAIVKSGPHSDRSSDVPAKVRAWWNRPTVEQQVALNVLADVGPNDDVY